jgi:preprotein translocase subunit YajC
MGSRERKRAERRKRKERTIQHYSERSEARNVEAREALEPLEEGERPLVVTIGAIISAITFVLAVAGYALWSVLRDDPRPGLFGVIMFAVLMGAMAYGMWKARYWAVLGFQVVLVFVMLGSAGGLVTEATTLGEIAGTTILLAGAGVLFYFMIRALARIQMPERLPQKD